MKLFYTLVFTVLTFGATAQNYTWEIGGGFGTSNYFGDIGGTEYDGKKWFGDLMLNTTKFNFSAFGRVALDYRFHGNVQFNYIFINGTDKLSPNTGRHSRNLSFENNLYEVLAMGEFHPLIINDLGNKRRFFADLHVYVSTGLGVIYNDPIGDFGGDKVKLRPIGTEGPENIYSPLTMVVPVAAGFFISFKGRYSSYRVHRVGINVNYRFTFTDYLDDVSTIYPDLAVFNGDESAIGASWRGWNERDPDDTTFPEGKIRGNPNSNDGYLTATFTYSKRIRAGKKNHKLPRRQEFYGRSKKLKLR